MNSEEFASVKTGGAGTEESSGVSPFRWAFYKSVMFRVVTSWDADIGLGECTWHSVNWQAVSVGCRTPYLLLAKIDWVGRATC